MPALLTAPAVHQTVVSDRREPAPDVIVLGLRAPDVATRARPGQFLMVVPPAGERCATALAVYECDGDRVTLLIVVVGPRTRELASIAPGAPLTLVGPLGNGFDLDALGTEPGLIAGGVGVASLYLAARELRERGANVHVYYGARTGPALVDAERFEDLGCTLTLTTDDGSRGARGFVTDAVRGMSSPHSGLAACGPSPMLRAVAEVAREFGIPAQLSLEEAFACGVGACWGCVVPLSRKSPQAPPFPQAAIGESRDYVHARICAEGPVFWAHELRW